jgi:HD-GYP domain-containing protein (c-di-GMP phosphodiesterase class II)
MAKLLDLVKSHEEFTNRQAPEVTSGDSRARKSTPSASADLAPTSRDEGIGVESERSGEELYGDTLQAVSRLFEAADMETVSPGSLLVATQEAAQVASRLAAEPAHDGSLLTLSLGPYPEGTSFVLPHSANVAILAAFVGYHLGLPSPQLTATVLAGLTHDIGSVMLPSGLLNKVEPLTGPERELLLNRPTCTHDLLFALGQEFEPIAEIAYQVYERLDGSGYPRGLDGDQILVEARILGTVDCFETTTHPRPYRSSPPCCVNLGIEKLVPLAGQFGRDVLKALVRSVGMFPVGSYVFLSTGEIARVLKGSQENPMRPTVEVIFDKKKERTEPHRVVDLVASPHIYISKSLSNQDLVELQLIDAPRGASDEAIRGTVSGEEADTSIADSTGAPE